MKINLFNLGGLLLPCQEFGPAMIARGSGSIINIASVSAHLPLSRVAAYSASKAALLNLTQFLARKWAFSGVRVNSITPGFFLGEQNRRLLVNEDGSETSRGRAILGHTPMRRFGEAAELVGAVLFLASEAASSCYRHRCQSRWQFFVANDLTKRLAFGVRRLARTRCWIVLVAEC